MGTTKSQLQQLAQERLDAAQALLEASVWSSAYYLAGYAVELSLKASIAGKFRSDEIPDKKFVNDIHTHDLRILLKLSGLEQRFQADTRLNPALQDNWVMTSDWRETSRYEMKTRAEAQDLVSAIGDPVNGVFAWLKKHW